MEAAGVPVIHFRYVAPAAGMDVVAVAERPGHRSPALTLQVYAHPVPGAPARARGGYRCGAQVGF